MEFLNVIMLVESQKWRRFSSVPQADLKVGNDNNLRLFPFNIETKKRIASIFEMGGLHDA